MRFSTTSHQRPSPPCRRKARYHDHRPRTEGVVLVSPQNTANHVSQGYAYDSEMPKARLSRSSRVLSCRRHHYKRVRKPSQEFLTLLQSHTFQTGAQLKRPSRTPLLPCWVSGKRNTLITARHGLDVLCTYLSFQTRQGRFAPTKGDP